jgi:putative membrane protein
MKPIEKRGKGHTALLFIKGMMMGAADTVPGVSGGSIAFMTGIYEELIYSLKQCGPSALSVLFKQGIKAAWQHVNGSFLLTLLCGIILSGLTIAQIVLFWLDEYPVQLWSFFFGLILATIWSVAKHIDHWKPSTYVSFILGTSVAYLITTLVPSTVETTYLTFFIAGAIAICAMILPGISGSFILLLMGMYSPVLQALKDVDLPTIVVFASGCVTGLLSFSHALNWMFSRHKTMTLAVLGGFLLGSLNKVWPWKIALESTVDSHGKSITLVSENVLPQSFETMTQQPAYFVFSVSLVVLGVAIVVLMEKLGKH